MSKSTKTLGVADGFFTQSEELPPFVALSVPQKNEPSQAAPRARTERTKVKTKPESHFPVGEKQRVGRPKAADLRDNTPVQRVGLYLTVQQKRKVAVYAAEKGLDQSAVIRMLIDKYL